MATKTPQIKVGSWVYSEKNNALFLVAVIEGCVAALNVAVGHRWGQTVDFVSVDTVLTAAELDVLFPKNGGNYYAMTATDAGRFLAGEGFFNLGSIRPNAPKSKKTKYWYNSHTEIKYRRSPENPTVVQFQFMNGSWSSDSSDYSSFAEMIADKNVVETD